MPSLVEDAKSSAEWMAVALNSSGYPADFTLESLSSLDRFFEEQSSAGRALPNGLLAANLGARLFALGSYVGEVLCRAFQGKWQADDQDAQGEINIQVIFPNGGVVWPVQRVIKRFQNGPEYSLLDYGLALRAHAS